MERINSASRGETISLCLTTLDESLPLLAFRWLQDIGFARMLMKARRLLQRQATGPQYSGKIMTSAIEKHGLER